MSLVVRLAYMLELAKDITKLGHPILIIEVHVHTKTISMVLYVFREGVMQITTVFSSPEKKTSWEAAFKEAKQKLGKCTIN